MWRVFYPRECEVTRMKNIFQACGGIPVVFIRYNPDKYQTDGKLVISQMARERILIENLNYLMKLETIVELLSVKYLFYDGYHKETKREEIKNILSI